MSSPLQRRYFIAIPIPEEVQDEILDIQEGLEDVRWAPPEKLHLTLHFLGDLPENARKEVVHMVEHLSFTPFELTPKGLGFFPPRGEPHVLWLGLEAGQELIDLHHKIQRKLFTMGLKLEERKFVPHITLGRFETADTEQIAQYLHRHELKHYPSFLVDEFYLYSSRPGKHGTFYQIEN